MQTFVPYDSFEKSFKVLDYKRLGKQRVEALQILNVLNNPESSVGWRNHPAVLMWKGYEDCLRLYHDLCISEWTSRGYRNNMKYFILDKMTDFSEIEYPWWFGNENMHRSHRARLIQKNRDFYLPLFPEDENFNDGKYFWPVNDTKTFKII